MRVSVSIHLAQLIEDMMHPHPSECRHAKGAEPWLDKCNHQGADAIWLGVIILSQEAS